MRNSLRSLLLFYKDLCIVMVMTTILVAIFIVIFAPPILLGVYTHSFLLFVVGAFLWYPPGVLVGVKIMDWINHRF